MNARLVSTLALAATLPLAGAAQQPAPGYEVYAVRYAVVKNFRVAGLVAGADTSRRMDIAMMVWLLKGRDGRNVLVDAGFQRDDLIQRWKPADYVTPSAAVAQAGVKPEDITDVIVSHVHWDHMDGVTLFPNARIWIQREEFEHHLDMDGNVLDRAIDAQDAAMLAKLYRAGHVALVGGDAVEIIPGITVYVGGKHTFQSQFVGVHTAAGTVVLASDNAYLYENLEKHAAIAQTVDAASNLRAQDRMMKLASSPRLIVPGHDPAVFERFPSPGKGVARIQ
ncbi:MAG TPA: N-acyl homoserine lactonase family protein [Gemmatimonadaceae bacterium]|nr:N-acyl homoserine lactonase family protein [Gemmatimonadaceae bacterium]